MLDQPENPVLLAEAMSRLMGNPTISESAGRWLRAKIEGHFDWSRVAKEFEDIYDSLLVSAT